jgi:sensor domain CHASE-containing protein
MTLRTRIAIIFSCAVLAIGAAVWNAVDLVLTRSFGDLERLEATHRMAQATRALANEVDNLNNVVADYSAWDDAYAYLAHPTKAFVSSNLTDDTFTRLRLEVIVLLDNRGVVVWGRNIDAKADHTSPLSAAWRTQLVPRTPLVYHTKTNSLTSGLTMVGGEPWLISSQPITTSKNEGPIRGTLIMGRRLDGAYVQRLERITALNLRLVPLTPEDAGPTGATVSLDSPGRLTARSVLKDVNRRGAVAMVMAMSREIDAQRRLAQVTLLAFTIAGALVFLTITLGTVERYILKRTAAIGSVVRGVREDGNLSVRVHDRWHDEIGEVSIALNDLLATLEQRNGELEHARAQALQASKYTSEFVANMGHEIRTPLNGVVGMTSMLLETPLSADQRELVGTARRSAEALLLVLNDIRDVSKMEAGQLAVEHASFEVEPLAQPEQSPAPSKIGIGLRVLVVEDNEINQQVTRRLLERQGCRVETANDGSEGIAAVQREVFDLVLMDCQMPGVDGYEATRRIRGLGRQYADLPIVALTASTRPDERARCLTSGMNDCLTTPLRPGELARVVTELTPAA